MIFNVVEVPEKHSGEVALVVNAMVENLGKALALPLENRDSNAYRKLIRAACMNRKLLMKNLFRSKVDGENLVVWLEPK